MYWKTVSDRRKFLKVAGLQGVMGLAAGMSAIGKYPLENSIAATSPEPVPMFIPVMASENRVIRTVAGLRPFRPSGFVLKAEKIGRKLVIHNYGHGGGGVSLSWGCAALAAEKIEGSRESRVAVAGCGVIGLSTALILQRKGFIVTIYTKDLPPDTTSNVACALWSPGSVFEDRKADGNFLNTFYRASVISQRMFQDYTADRYGVHWIRTYFLGGGFHFPGGRDLYPGYRLHRDEKSYFGYQEVDEISSLLIETPVYLNTLLQDFRLAGGEIIIRPLTTARDMTGMKEKIIFNCTGLGAAQLFNDQEMIPVKGQLSVLLPQPEIDYAYVAHSPGNLLYMFPRKDGIVLGGTYDKGNWSLEPDENESLRILNGHAAIAEYLVRNFTL